MNTFNCIADTDYQRHNLPYFSDKALLPQSVLESLLSLYNHDELPSPLIFKVSNPQNKQYAFIGVKQFTAESNTVVLPGVIQQSLKLTDNDGSAQSKDTVLQISLMDSIPKGNTLTLKSLNVKNTENIINLKFFLEANLSINYTTLTENNTLSIANTMGGKLTEDQAFEFLITKTEPAQTVCIINTDLVFDLQPMDDKDAENLLSYKQNLINETNAKDNDLALDLNTNISDIKINTVALDQSLPQNQVAIKLFKNEMYKVPISNTSQAQFQVDLTVKSKNFEDLNNLDLLVSNDQFIAPDSFIWSTINSTVDPTNISKTISIKSTDQWLSNRDCLYFLGHNWSALLDGDYEVVISYGDIDQQVHQSGQSQNQNQNQLLNDNETVCSNCGKVISKNNQFLHENFCNRNNIKCPKGCGEIFLRTIPDTHWHCDICANDDRNPTLHFGSDVPTFNKHNKFNHEPTQANDLENLPQLASFLALAIYKATVWENKLHECKFCHLVLPKGKSDAEDLIMNLSHHENKICGTKTVDCFKCGKIVKYKDLESHLKIHDLNRLSKNRQLNYIKCMNVNCVNVLKVNANALANDHKLNELLGLCESCFGQFYSSAYDPDYKRLNSRFERRYMIQLTRGCGNSFCKNQACLSSGLYEKKTSKEALSYSRELLSKVPNLNKGQSAIQAIGNNGAHDAANFAYYFCVNELTTKRKLFVDHYYTFLADRYMYYWVCMSVNELKLSTEEAGNLSRIEGWLTDHAITIQEMKA